MRATISALVIGVALASQAQAGTALEAIRLLPQAQVKNLALIEGRDGTPVPERWHLLVHDPKEENGYREFVVSGEEILASRSISQFAENLQARDVIGADAVKIDSDYLTRLAQLFASANDFTIGRINYALKKGDNKTGAVWKLSCWDISGANAAELTVTANKGDVVTHEGFATVPDKNDEKLAGKPLDEKSKKSDSPASQKKDAPGAAIGRTLSKIFGGGKKDAR